MMSTWRFRIGVLAVMATVLGGLYRAQALDNGIARTPPMGWNSWNRYACDRVNERVVREAADQMAANGMKDAGYKYVVIDDCWQAGRDKAGNISADESKFPSGMKALGDYIHGKGLSFGIYTDAGTMTCEKRPGSMGHEYQDAQQYADWGVDYLKEDWCNTLPGQSAQASYTLMRNALAATGRPIVFSICEWGTSKPWLWAAAVGNLWRATGDIQDCWDCSTEGGDLDVMQILDRVSGLNSYAGPGHWTDPDMLEVGNGGMTETEYRSHFSLWALLSAPLLAGNDLSVMSASTRDILLNREVIAVDQDAMGVQGERVKKNGDMEVWSKQLADGGRAVILLNRSRKAGEIAVTWENIGYPGGVRASVRDLWKHKDLGSLAGGFSAEVPSHGVVMVKVMP